MIFFKDKKVTEMKLFLTNLMVWLVSSIPFYGQETFDITSDILLTEAQFNLKANTAYDFFISVFLDENASITQFKTLINGENELQWDISKINRNEWVTLLHSFTVDNNLNAPVVSLSLIDDPIMGSGFGTFYVDDISIREKPSGTLSVNDILENDLEEENQMEVFPIPTTKILYIDNISQESKIDLFTVLGQPLLVSFDSQNNTINLENLTPGVYFLKVISKTNSVTIKRIIKE